MAPKLEPLNLRIIGNSAGLSAALGRAKNSVMGFSLSMQRQTQGLRNALQAIALPSFLTAGLGASLKLAADLEQTEAAFRSLTGSVANAEKIIGELRDFAARTPLQFTGLTQATQTLLAYGSANEEVVGQLQMLADVALGNQGKLDRLALAFGQVQAKGRLMAEEVRQMVENGFNPLQEIARTSGRSMGELLKAMERGEISFEIVTNALRTATSEGGRFFNAMENQSRTLSGRFTRLSDNIKILATDIGEALLPAAGAFVERMIEIVDTVRNFDIETAEAVAKTIAFSAALSSAAIVLPRLVSLASAVATAIQNIAKASAVAQALSGPKGWAVLIGSLAAAGGAVLAVDQLFDSMADTQSKVVETSNEVAEAQDSMAKSTLDAMDAAQDAVKAQEEWTKTADKLRLSLETPVEKYQRQIQQLTGAVRDGGLEWEFLSRGIRKAMEDLDKATRRSSGVAKRPDALLAGSEEAEAAIFRSNQLAAATQADPLDQRVANAVEDIKVGLAREEAQAAALKAELAEAAEVAAEANVDRLNAGFEKAKQELRQIVDTVNELGQDLNYDRDIDLGRGGSTAGINAIASQLGSLLGSPVLGDDGGVVFDQSKQQRFEQQQASVDQKLAEVLKKEEELTRAQAEAASAKRDAADARREAQLARQEAALGNLADAIRNKPEPQPMRL